MLTCKQKDHDGFDTICGFPIPCPYHTVIMDLSSKPPQLRIPVTAESALSKKDELKELTFIISKEFENK